MERPRGLDTTCSGADARYSLAPDLWLPEKLQTRHIDDINIRNHAFPHIFICVARQTFPTITMQPNASGSVWQTS